MYSSLIEEKWVSISLGGIYMEKINLPFFYDFGTRLHPLTEMKADLKTYIKLHLHPFVYTAV